MYVNFNRDKLDLLFFIYIIKGLRCMENNAWDYKAYKRNILTISDEFGDSQPLGVNAIKHRNLNMKYKKKSYATHS